MRGVGEAGAYEVPVRAARLPRPAPARAVRPVAGPVTSEFGPRWGRLHAGLDLGVPVGTPVRAVEDGGVRAMEYDPRGYGHAVAVLHADGSTTMYAHLSKVLLGEGQVRAGDVLGRSGNTGHSTGPHLHFEVRTKGGPVDPRPWLVARGLRL